MKSKIIKLISFCLCIALLACGAIYAFASNKSGKEADTAENVVEEKKQEKTEAEGDKSETFKNETVYVIADADGTVQKVIVSDWIENKAAADRINDVTELQDVENIKGDEKYTMGGGKTRIWDAQGNDIYYQGTIEKELPVKLYVSYKLDGKPISPEELAGKSGRVTIRFDYVNSQYATVNIKGKDEKIYVPFVMLTGVLLDNDTFSNVEVSNGKIINDGDRTAVIGFALPGLQENLDIDKEKFKFPSYVEITADTKNFSLGMTVTIATNALFSEIDMDKIDSISDLKDSMNELDKAMAKLLDGSSALYEGLCTLLDKSYELVKGIDRLAEGVAMLKEGAYSLDEGAKQLYDGVTTLSMGLNTLSANNDALNEGAKKVFETFLSTSEKQIKAAGLSIPALTIDNYNSVLNQLIQSLDEANVYNQALAQVKATVEAKRDFIESQVTATVRTEVEKSVTSAVREQVKAEVIKAIKAQVYEQVCAAVRENVESQVIFALTGKDKGTYDAAMAANLIDTDTQGKIKAAIEEQMKSAEVTSLIASKVDEQMQSEAIAGLIAQKTDEQMKTEQVKNIIASTVNSKMSEEDVKSLIEQNTEAQIQKAISEAMASQEVQKKLEAASEAVKSLISLKASLDEYNAFYLGLMKYTAGVTQAADGASALKSGAGQLQNGTNALYNGIAELYDGILTMKNGAPALIDGIYKLRDGAMQLSDGLAEFNEQGIQKLLDEVDDVQDFIDRLKATVDVSRSYKSFAGISDEADGNVRFIYKIREIE